MAGPRAMRAAAAALLLLALATSRARADDSGRRAGADDSDGQGQREADDRSQKGRCRKDDKRTIVVLGDSLSDQGRLYNLTKGVVPNTTIYPLPGRWTNGYVWVDYLQLALGLCVKFRNYAVAGATSIRNLSETSYPFLTQALPGAPVVDSVPVQLDSYLTDLKGQGKDKIPPIVILWSGNNDIIIGAYSVALGQLPFDQLPGVATKAANATVDVLKKLLKKGGKRTVVLTTIGDSSTLPLIKALGLPAVGLRSVVDGFNDALRTAYKQLASDAQNKNPVLLWDVAKAFDDAAANRTGQFTDFENPCATIKGQTNGVLDPNAVLVATCANPNQSVQWDGIHPTTAIHAALAQGLAQLLAAAGIQLGGKQ